MKGTKPVEGLHSLWNKEEAAVTAFFLPVGAAMLLLFLAVFNYGRYLMAERQAELALEASLTSVLSYYEPHLTREMGLFALDTTDKRLPEKGREYFVSNLGASAAINGQLCLSYSLDFPIQSRLAADRILIAQAIDTRRLEGWVEMGQDLLGALGVADWQNLLSAPARGLSFSAHQGSDGLMAGEGAGEGVETGGGMAGVQEGLAQDGGASPEWLRRMEDNARADTGRRIRFWQFLSSRPPAGVIEDRRMPAGLGMAWQAPGETWAHGASLDEQADFWEETFLNPLSAVSDTAFLTKMTNQVSEFLSAIGGSLAGYVDRGREKLLFTEYLLHEMDFATNKPAMNRYFARGEVEYILCGHERAWDNLRSMALRLFLMRTCLHFITNPNAIQVVDEAAFIAAIVDSILQGGADVEKLFAGERVPSIPGMQGVMLSYKDHLRLFLLCQSEAAQKQAMQRLVQANLWHWARNSPLYDGYLGATGNAAAYSLSRYASQARAAVETELILWPFGRVQIRREGVMGYDTPFALLS
ncbi:MAG: DUF5702 domain-containing protein [Clostridiales bacterium]|nr:DUF5702 domain-containing protein [Clostridiales bacterium]